MKEIKLSDHFTYTKLFRFVLPSICMMMFTSIYGVVDGYFVSNYAGKTAFAAINLIMPFLMILGGMGFMLGTGGTALVSRVLGEKDEKRANAYFSMTILFTVVLGIVLTAVGLVLMRPVAIWFGATPEMVDDCVLYGNIVVSFTTMFMLQNVFQSFVVAAERPTLGLIATLAAGFTNMILDWLFVGVFGWGIAGAAIATGLSQTVGGVLPLVYFLLPNASPLRLRWTRLQFRPLLLACSNGSSELMSNVSASVVSIVYNHQLLRYLGEDGVSAYGVLMYVQFIFVAIFVGYAVGSAPIVSYHYGAQNDSELKNLLKKSLRLMTGLGVGMMAAAWLLATPLAQLYVGYDEGLFELTHHAFQLFSFAFLLSGINIYASSFFTALNNGGVSAAISFLRTLLFQTAAVLILPLLIGVDGLWWAMTAAEVFAFLISVVFLVALRKKYRYF